MSENILLVCPHCEAINRIPEIKMGDAPLCGQCKKPLLLEKAIELTSQNFDRHIQRTDLPILVDFWAPWCAPCKMMAPVIESVAKKRNKSIRVAKLNTDQENTIAARFGIRSIPTLIIFSKGRIVSQRAGAINENMLIEWIDSVI